MTPIQTPPGMSESAVDMSPEAIMSRLEMIGQLNELCRFLASGTILPRQENIDPPDESAPSAPTGARAAKPVSEPERPRYDARPASDSIIAERIV
jgi:hypothetical protein